MDRAQEDSSKVKPPRRRKRVIVLAVLAAIVLLIWSAPYVVSSGALDSILFSAIDDELTGTVRWQELTLSWLGPCRIDGLAVKDAQGRSIADVEQIEYAGGLWHAILRPLSFDTVTVQKPIVTVYVDEEPASLVAPSDDDDDDDDSSEASGPAEPVGTVAITGGVVRLIRADESTYELKDVNATLTLETLNDIAAEMSIRFGGGGVVSMDVAVSNLLAGGAPSLETLSAHVKAKSDEAILLGPLTGFLAPAGRVDGAADIRVDIQLDQGTVTAGIHAAGKGLRSANKDYKVEKPIDVSFGTTAKGDARALAGEMNLSVGGAGSIWLKLSASEPGKASLPDAKVLVAAVMEGKDVTLPNVKLTGGGEIHLAPIAQAVPSVLNVLPDVTVQSGTLAIKRLSVEGGVAPTADIGIVLSELSARKGETQFASKPVSLDIQAGLMGGRGLVVKKAHLVSTFAELTGSGTPEKMTFNLAADVASLKQEMGTVFDLSVLPKRGTLRATVDVSQPQKGSVALVLSANVMDLQHAWAGKQLSLASVSAAATVDASTDLETLEAKIQSGSVRGLAVAAVGEKSPDVLDLNFSGRVNRAGSKIDGTVDLAADVRPRAATAEVTGGAVLLSGNFDVTLPADDKAPVPAAAGVLAYLLEGKSPTLPELTAEIKKSAARVDVPAVLKALPAFAPAAGEWEILQAVLTLEQLKVTGGRELAVELTARVSPLQVRRTYAAVKGAKPTTGELKVAQPWRVVLSAAGKGGQGVRVQTFLLQERSGDAGTYRDLVHASLIGPANQPVAKVAADLTTLHARLKPILGSDVPELAGTLSNSTTLLRTPDGLAFSGKVSGRKLVLIEAPVAGKASQPRHLGDLDIEHNGSVALAAKTLDPISVDIESATVQLGKDVSLKAAGAYEIAAKKYKATVSMKDVLITPLLELAKAAGAEIDLGATYAGKVTSTIDVTGTPEQVLSEGSLDVSELQVDGNSAGDADTTIDWREVVYHTADGRIAIGQAKVGGPMADMFIQPLTIHTGEALALNGTVTINAVNLGTAYPLVRPMLEAY